MTNLIEDGSIERLLIAVLVYGPMAYLWVTHQAVDDRLIDVALVILGFYFGTITQRIASKMSDDQGMGR